MTGRICLAIVINQGLAGFLRIMVRWKWAVILVPVPGEYVPEIFCQRWLRPATTYLGSTLSYQFRYEQITTRYCTVRVKVVCGWCCTRVNNRAGESRVTEQVRCDILDDYVS